MGGWVGGLLPRQMTRRRAREKVFWKSSQTMAKITTPEWERGWVGYGWVEEEKAVRMRC